ncbi:UDP-N-acetylmuramoyl-L-alanyl-D-glutamate--2,6-diaminopimelate ligase [Corynebacterium flavescens]|uniref:UDP-N-acetylmuramoyl-L-alanyl-D-glutamate--2, 6-diaminopimelate ligase n=1 Tax=Corynebacterium flavescens TaxID=28028 RepID=UPI003FD08753
MAVTLHKLAEISGGRVIGDARVEVSSCGLDSTSIASGALFAALPGTHAHGAKFAADTPAAAILTDAAGLEILSEAGEQRPIIAVEDIRAVLGTIAAEIYNHPSSRLTVVGVTGTSGKTTTSYLLEAGLLHAGFSVGLIGTTGTRINREPVATKLTTPEAPTLQELFLRMLEQGVTHVVMEVSSHALELGRVRGTRFAVGGFTNLSQDHLDFHPTMEAYFHAKARLFSGEQAARQAVVCIDDKWGREMEHVARDSGLEVSSVATDPAQEDEATYFAQQVRAEASGVQEVEVRSAHGEVDFRLPLPGKFNIANAALALGMARAIGVDSEVFAAGLAHVSVPGRMQAIHQGQDFLAIVDYAHKPAAVAAVLDTLRGQLSTDSARIAVVIGAGGDRDTTKRPLMGAAAAQRADLVIVTDDNPRSEDPALIRSEVLEGARHQGGAREVREIGSRAQAIQAAVEWAQPGDAVIVVGKGHEIGQIIGDHTYHFDDREELSQAIEDRIARAAGNSPSAQSRSDENGVTDIEEQK